VCTAYAQYVTRFSGQLQLEFLRIKKKSSSCMLSVCMLPGQSVQFIISCWLLPADIQQGMGTERTLTNNALKAVICPSNTYGVGGANGSARNFGLDHSPCTACPANMITGHLVTAAVKAVGIRYHVSYGTGLSSNALLNGSFNSEPAQTLLTGPATSDADTGSGTGYHTVKACANRPGFGYYNGASQMCPQGFYNAAGSNTPCSQ